MMKSRGEQKQDALLDGGFRYCGVAAAMVGAAVIGGVASNSAAKKGSKAQIDSTNAANTSQLAAQRESQAFQQKQADIARADREPWRVAGVNALGKLARTPDFTGASVATDPGYQFALSEGMKGLTNSAAARGGLLSGAALKAASQYNNDYATTKFDAAFQRDSQNKNRLATLAGVGQTAASQNGSNAMTLGGNVADGFMNMGNQIGQNQIGAGNARASGYLAQGNALTGALNQGVSAWNQHNNANYNRLYNSPNNYGGGYNQDGTFSPNTYGSNDSSYNRVGSTPPPAWD